MLRKLIIALWAGLLFLPGPLYGSSYVQKSVLAEGYWVKMKIDRSGIYKITYEQLEKMGLPDPSRPHLFGNGGGMLPEKNSASHPDDLLEIPVKLYKGPDNEFNKGDYLLFYATGPVRWYYSADDSSFYHINPLYDKGAYYFITSSSKPVKEITTEPFVDDPPTDTCSSFDDYRFHDTDRENLIKSGREWYEPLPTLSPVTFNFSFPGRITHDVVRMRIRVIARSSRTSYFSFAAGDHSLPALSVGPVNIYSYTSAYARAGSRKYVFTTEGEDLPVTISSQSSDQTNARAWLDYIDIQARSQLVLTGNQLAFRDIRTAGPGNITSFYIMTEGGEVWDVTDIHKVSRMETKEEYNALLFRVHTDSLRQFIVFRGNDFPSPEIVEKEMPNQNLHGLPQAGLVIVSYPDFMTRPFSWDSITTTMTTCPLPW
jgi:hypothetical protein